MVDAGGSEVKGVDVDGQGGEKVGEHGDGHAGAGEGGEANEPDELRQRRTQRLDAIYECQR